MSPEGHAKRRASSEILAVNADGSGLTSLTKNDEYDGDPSWAGDIKRIFFASNRSGASADVQVSPVYPGGVALRFAPVKRYRSDTASSEADTFATVRALLPPSSSA